MTTGVITGSKTYGYCEDCTGATQSVVVTLQPGTCTVQENGVNGYGDYVYKSRVNLVFTIPAPIDCNLVINYKYNWGWIVNSVQDITGMTPSTVTIPAGQISKTVTNQQCIWIVHFDNNPATNQTLEQSYELNNQLIVPSCTQPLGCNLEITGTTSTPPSLIGSSDGSITVGISGATGSSYTFRLNGGIPQSSNVFDDIPSGTYQVRVEEGGCYSEMEVVVPPGAYNTSPFVVTYPSWVVAAENPIMLELKSAFFDASELHSTTNITINDDILNNYRVSFHITSPINYSANFYAKDFPDKTTYFLSNQLKDQNNDFVKVNTTTEIADSLAQVLQNDIIISSAYYVNVNANVITLKAKTASSRFDLSYNNITTYSPSSVVVVTGATVAVVQEGTDRYEASIIDNYYFYAELYGNRNESIEYGTDLSGASFDRITELQLPFLRGNQQKFDFSEICKSFVSTPKPDYNISGFTTVTTYMQPFFIKYGELYPLIPNTPTSKKKQKGSTGHFWVCNAALEFEKANNMNEYLGNIISGYTRYVPFLTNSPTVKRASRRQGELLYFIVPKDLNQGTLAVKGDILFWDGNTLPTQTFITITSSAVNFGGALQINVSFDVLGLDEIEATENRLIKQLNIGVYSGTGTTRNVTEIKSYFYDLEEHSNRVGISWINKLGTFDSFDFYGQAEETFERSAKTYTVPREPNADGSLNAGFKYNAAYDVAVTKKLTVNSGFIDSETMDWLSEVINSNEIYIYSNQYDNYVTVAGFKHSKSTNETLFNLELELDYTIFENNVSI